MFTRQELKRAARRAGCPDVRRHIAEALRMGWARTCSREGRGCYWRNARRDGRVRTLKGVTVTTFGEDHANNLHPTNASVQPTSPEYPAIPVVRGGFRGGNECDNDWAFSGTGGMIKVLTGKVLK